MQNRDSVEKELDEVKPTHVLNVAGVTGRPNVDWCESHKQDTILNNVVGTVSLMDACWRRNIHVTNYATGMPLTVVFDFNLLFCNDLFILTF